MRGVFEMACKPGAVGPVRVLVVHQHTLVREGLQRLINGFVGMEANGLARLSTLPRWPTKRSVDVVVLDGALDGWQGIDPGGVGDSEGRASPVLLLTADPTFPTIVRGLQQGATGIALQEATPRALETALRTVASGETALCPSSFAAALAGMIGQRGQEQQKLPDVQTFAEEIMTLIREGQTLAEIANATGTSEETVEAHVRALSRQYGVHDPATLVREILRRH